MKSSTLLIFLSLIFTSCSWQNWQKDTQPKIRIVDLQGKSRPIVTRVPELNNKALADQGKMMPNMALANAQKQQISPKYQQPTIKNYQDANIANAQATKAYPTNQPVKEILGVREVESAPVIEYNLADSKKEKKRKKKYVHKKSKQDDGEISKTRGKKFFVQVGAFSNKNSAESLLRKMKKFHSGKIKTVKSKRTIHRVLIGPFSSKRKAQAILRKINKSGQDAILTRSE